MLKDRTRYALEDVERARYALETSLPAVDQVIAAMRAGERISLEAVRDRVHEASRALTSAVRTLDGVTPEVPA